MVGKSKIKPYQGAAGGWGSLISSARHLLKSGRPVRGVKTLLNLNQGEGFDCPGCAWGDPEATSSFEFCENGVKAVAWEATSKKVTAEFFVKHTVTELESWDGYALEGEGRLTAPMSYDPASDKYKPVSWDDAFALIGAELSALKSPAQAAFYTSGRTSNEAAFLYQLLAREFGTNNLPDCSNMCHEPSGVALKETIGTGKGTVRLEDFEKAEAIFIFGQNPGTNYPRMLGDLQRAAARGCKIVSFNPLRERGLEKFADPKHIKGLLPGAGEKISSHYFQLRIGGDRAAALGIMKHLWAMEQKGGGVFDHTFIKQHTTGLKSVLTLLDQTRWRGIESQSGLAKEDLAIAAKIYARSKATIFTWAMGITQHQGATETIQTLVNLQLLKGNVGKPGAGICPVRGHSNVQGDRTMGIDHQPTPDFLDLLDKEFKIKSPCKPGLSSVEVIEAMAAGKVRVFIGLGGNFAAASPATALTEKALRACDLTVHISTKLNRSHLVHGKKALILPTLGRTEIDFQSAGPQMISVEDSMSMVHASSGLNMPASKDLRSEVAIVCGMARAALPGSKTPWREFKRDYRLIRERIEQVIPGFEAFNERIAVPGGFYLGNSAAGLIWNTKTGKAAFFAHPLQQRSKQEGKVFTLTTFRSHDQYNTSIYGLNDRYRGVKGTREVLFMNPEDISAQGLTPETLVDVRNAAGKGQLKGFRLVPYNIPRGNVAAYFPEANVLVAIDAYDQRSKTPASKSIPVIIRKSL